VDDLIRSAAGRPSGGGSLSELADKHVDAILEGAARLHSVIAELSDGEEDEVPAEVEYDVLEDFTEAAARLRSWTDGLLEAAGLPPTSPLPGETGEEDL